MITSFKKEINKNRSNLLVSDLNKYVVDKNQTTEYSERLWFKGSRYR